MDKLSIEDRIEKAARQIFDKGKHIEKVLLTKDFCKFYSCCGDEIKLSIKGNCYLSIFDFLLDLMLDYEIDLFLTEADFSLKENMIDILKHNQPDAESRDYSLTILRSGNYSLVVSNPDINHFFNNLYYSEN